MNQLFGTSCVTSYELKRRQSEIPMVEQNGGALSFNRFFCDSRFCRFCLFPSTYMSPTCIEPGTALRAGLPNGRLELHVIKYSFKVRLQDIGLNFPHLISSFGMVCLHTHVTYIGVISQFTYLVIFMGNSCENTGPLIFVNYLKFV